LLLRDLLRLSSTAPLGILLPACLSSASHVTTAGQVNFLVFMRWWPPLA
jgi:hypothetical protein